MNSRYRAPRDVYELRLTHLWTDLLRRADFGVQDDFFDLGGDPDRAEAVLAAVAAQFDAPVRRDSFFAAPTIERLACQLRARSSRLNEAPIVALQPGGAERPFFFVPSGEGNPFNFYALARELGPDRPVYGFQGRGLHGDAPAHDRVEDKAADHIEAMRAVQPHGPYLLGGHCVGAIVALEMALQLQRCGERVALLAAVDALAPAPFFADDDLAPVDDLVEFSIFMSKGFWYWFERNMGVERDALLAVPSERRAADFMSLAREHGIYTPDAADDLILASRTSFAASAATPTRRGRRSGVRSCSFARGSRCSARRRPAAGRTCRRRHCGSARCPATMSRPSPSPTSSSSRASCGRR